MPEEYGFVGTCTSCGSRMIEYARSSSRDERTIQFECQADDCSQTGLIRHSLDDGSVDDPDQQQGVEDVEVVELSWVDCSRCHGEGWVYGTWCDLERAMNGRDTPCPNCHRTGRVPRIVETDGGTTTSGFDRRELRRLAAERIENPRRDHPENSRLRVPELVRSMREIEGAAVRSHERGEVSRDFALGMWTAFAGLRHDFGIEDSRYVDTEASREEVDDGD